MAQLNSVLASTQGVAGLTADEVTAMADSLSQVTRFEDDAIVSAQSLLLTFTNIGQDVFPYATQVMLDMSTALGQDLSTSAMQLGKALNSPVEGIAALRRVGVQLSDEQEMLVKSLMATGDTARAQAVILAELQKEFGGSAVAAGQTMAGQMDILRNSLGNVKEEIGGALLPVLTQMVQQFGPVFLTAAQNFATWFIAQGLPALQTFGINSQDANAA